MVSEEESMTDALPLPLISITKNLLKCVSMTNDLFINTFLD